MAYATVPLYSGVAVQVFADGHAVFFVKLSAEVGQAIEASAGCCLAEIALAGAHQQPHIFQPQLLPIARGRHADVHCEQPPEAGFAHCRIPRVVGDGALRGECPLDSAAGGVNGGEALRHGGAHPLGEFREQAADAGRGGEMADMCAGCRVGEFCQALPAEIAHTGGGELRGGIKERRGGFDVDGHQMRVG